MEYRSLSFGEAIEWVKKGHLVTREGWNGKGMFIFSRPADDIHVTSLLGIKTLPKAVKDYFEKKHQPITTDNSPFVTFTSYLCMKAADDTIVNGWLASQTDMLATDWMIFENPTQS